VQVDVDRAGDGHRSLALAPDSLAHMDLESDVAGKLGFALARPPALLGDIVDGSAAQRFGLHSGDQVTAVDGHPVADWMAFTATVRAAPGKPLLVQGVRRGQPFSLSVTPDVGHQGALTIGKIGAYAGMGPDLVVVQSGPLEAVGRGAAKVWDTSVLTLRLIGKMVLGEVSLKNVTGPITIADYAGQTARIGAASYLSFIAFISISLGVMNLLPIPVLDGGLLLYYSLEVLTGRPVPERFGEIAQRVGVGLLVTLMALAVFNDVARLL
jgi:regulator of sigma E protease